MAASPVLSSSQVSTLVSDHPALHLQLPTVPPTVNSLPGSPHTTPLIERVTTGGARGRSGSVDRAVPSSHRTGPGGPPSVIETMPKPPDSPSRPREAALRQEAAGGSPRPASANVSPRVKDSPEVVLQKQQLEMYRVFSSLHASGLIGQVKGHLAEAMESSGYEDQMMSLFRKKLQLDENELQSRYTAFQSDVKLASELRTIKPEASREYWVHVGRFMEFHKLFIAKIHRDYDFTVPKELAIPENWDGTETGYSLPKDFVKRAIILHIAETFASVFGSRGKEETYQDLEDEFFVKPQRDYKILSFTCGGDQMTVGGRRSYHACFFGIVDTIFREHPTLLRKKYLNMYPNRIFLTQQLLECNTALNMMRGMAVSISRTAKLGQESQGASIEEILTPREGEVRAFGDLNHDFPMVVQEADKINYLKPVDAEGLVKIPGAMYLATTIKLIKAVERAIKLFPKAYPDYQKDPKLKGMFSRITFINLVAKNHREFIQGKLPFLQPFAPQSA